MLGIGLAVVGIALIAMFGWRWWTDGRFEESTDNAYLRADTTVISPQVAGNVAEVLVEDNQWVEAGQVLLRIDDADYRARRDQVRAGVAAAEAMLGNLDARLALQRALLRQAEAEVAAAEASLVFARREDERAQALLRRGVGTRQRAEQAEAVLRERSAALDAAQALRAAESKRLGVLESERRQIEADLARARAALELAEIELARTVIHAPLAGMVGNRAVRVGQHVQPGRQLLALVPLQAVYVVANYKETQVEHFRPGLPARIEVDAFPGAEIAGRIDSLAPATGAEFSILPPENATGNFTKIVQRVPVKIRLEPEAARAWAGRLRPGLSVVATVRTAAGEAAAEMTAGQAAPDQAVSGGPVRSAPALLARLP